MDEAEFKQRVRDEIEKFARASGIPYDRPNPLRQFDVRADGWHHVNAYTMARLSVLAYQDFELVREQLAEADVDRSRAQWFEDKATDTQGFGFVWADNAFLCFRGTESKRDVIIDVDKGKVHFDENQHDLGKVHKGFRKATESVWPQVEQFLRTHREHAQRVWVTGHSLGGAIATLVAARIVHSGVLGELAALYTFGQPRVGDRVFKARFIEAVGGNPVRLKKVFRIYRAADPVPMIPRIGFRHVSGERCYISRSGEMVIGARRRQKYLDRLITYVTTLPKVIGKAGRITELRALVSDHYSSGYLAKLRDNLLSERTVAAKDGR